MTVGSDGYRQQYIQLHCAVVREASIAMRLAATGDWIDGNFGQVTSTRDPREL